LAAGVNAIEFDTGTSAEVPVFDLSGDASGEARSGTADID
jgi:hypothetical protein